MDFNTASTNAESVHQSAEILPTINVSTTETAQAHVAVIAVLQPPYQHDSNDHVNETYTYTLHIKYERYAGQ
jgi:hypothetical protein